MYLLHDGVVIAQVRTGNPVSRIGRRVRRPSRGVCRQVGQDLDVGEDGGLGVDNLDSGEWDGCHQWEQARTLMAMWCGIDMIATRNESGELFDAENRPSFSGGRIRLGGEEGLLRFGVPV